MVQGITAGLCVDSTTPRRVDQRHATGGHALPAPATARRASYGTRGALSQDPPGDGWYRLLDQKTGYCLDGDGDGALYTLPCLNGDTSNSGSGSPTRIR